jgi:predicted phosphoribosyltransferase
VLNEEAVQHLGIPERAIEAIAAEELIELNRREQLYRGNRPPAKISGHRVILVDDGLATGSSMRAAVRALRQSKPASIAVAVPVASRTRATSFEMKLTRSYAEKHPNPFSRSGIGTRISLRQRTRKSLNSSTTLRISERLTASNQQSRIR